MPRETGLAFSFEDLQNVAIFKRSYWNQSVKTRKISINIILWTTRRRGDHFASRSRFTSEVLRYSVWGGAGGGRRTRDASIYLRPHTSPIVSRDQAGLIGLFRWCRAPAATSLARGEGIRSRDKKSDRFQSLRLGCLSCRRWRFSLRDHATDVRAWAGLE